MRVMDMDGELYTGCRLPVPSLLVGGLLCGRLLLVVGGLWLVGGLLRLIVSHWSSTSYSTPLSADPRGRFSMAD